MVFQMSTVRKIFLARPCIVDASLFIAESSFGSGLDMDVVCSILKELEMPEMRCSAKLGVARFSLDNWQVMIYKNGHIDIRRVKDIDDAAKAIEMVGIMLKDGFTG